MKERIAAYAERDWNVKDLTERLARAEDDREGWKLTAEKLLVERAEAEIDAKEANDRAEECEVYRNELSTSDAWYAKRAELEQALATLSARVDLLEGVVRNYVDDHARLATNEALSKRTRLLLPDELVACDCVICEYARRALDAATRSADTDEDAESFASRQSRDGAPGDDGTDLTDERSAE